MHLLLRALLVMFPSRLATTVMVMGVSAADRLLRPLSRLPWVDLMVPFAELSIAHVISSLHIRNLSISPQWSSKRNYEHVLLDLQPRAVLQLAGA